MIYRLLKLVVKISLHVFFRKIIIHSKVSLPKYGPLIIVVNHPNTFMDPLIVATLFKQKVGFLANASVFVNEIINSIFRYFNVIPVYRQKDVNEGSQPDNTKTFEECTKYLKQGNALMIFPEGSSYNELRLRKIKTGTARIALNAESQNNFKLGIKILPIGLYYSDPSRFRSKIYINIDEPIEVAGFKDVYNDNPVLGVQELTANIKNSLEENVIITQDEEQEDLFLKIKRVYKNRLLQKSENPEAPNEEFRLTKELAKAIQYFQINSEETFQHIKNLIEEYVELIDEAEVKHSDNKRQKSESRTTVNQVLRIIYLIVGLPLYFTGMIQNYIPYKLPFFIAKKITKEIEYHAPIMLSVGILIFPLCYSLLVIGFYHLISTSALHLIIYFAFLPLSGFYCLHYIDLFQKTKGRLKLYLMLRKSDESFLKMSNLESEIIRLLDEAREVYLKRL